MAWYDNEAQERKNQWHLENPQVGDYWHEMCCPICEVVAVQDGKVAIWDWTRGREVKGEDGWYKEVDKPHVMSLASFQKSLRYSTNSKTYGDVIPASERKPKGGE